jgi:thiamine-phosphate pyrophosphorylase
VADGPRFRAVATALLQAGGANLALHLRLREMAAGRQHELAAALSASAREAGSWCVINGRVDVALTAGAQAVQLGRGALGIGAARSVLGAGVPIGSSVHSAAEAARRAADGADYLIVGTVFPTPTHPGAALGTEVVRACRGAGPPIVGIGGIEVGNARQVLEAGASGIAVVRAVWEAVDPVRAARDLLSILDG